MTNPPKDLLNEMAREGHSARQADLFPGTLPKKKEWKGDAVLRKEPDPDAVARFDPALHPLKGAHTATQKQALVEADLKRGHCWFIDPGGGKTATVISEASGLFKRGKIDGVLWIGPHGPHEQVVDEQFPLWCAIDWRGIHSSMGKQVTDKFYSRAADDIMGVFSINYELINRRSGRRAVERFMAKYPRVYVAIDESQCVKDWRAQRTHECTMIARQAIYRRLLTGTPLLKGVEDLFTQFDIAWPGITGHRKFTSFRAYYCIEAPIPGARSAFAKQITGYRNQDELKRRVAPIVTRIEASQFRPEADVTLSRVRTPMSREQAQHYNQMRHELLVLVDEGAITVENALTQVHKLNQIASGFILDEEGAVHWISDNKINAVHTLLDSMDEHVIVFAPYIPLQDRLEEALRARGDRPVQRYRGKSGTEDVKAWRSNGGVIIGNQTSGLGVGWNLQFCAATIYAANASSAGARWQSLGRTNRLGQERQCRFWDIVAPGTRDEKTLRVLGEREDLAYSTLSGIRSFLVDD